MSASLVPVSTPKALLGLFAHTPHSSLKPTTKLRSSQNPMEAAGLDTDGKPFRNAREMWREVIGTDADPDAAPTSGKRQEWYGKAITYWQGVDASVDGVLGGYGHVNDVDVKGSDAFLKNLLVERFGGGRRNLVALDCGSGIGRVTKNLLLRHFNEVDLVEPVSHFLDTARENLSSGTHVVDGTHKAVNFYCTPLQEFTPETGRYDVIWVQWCIGQLTDDDFVTFFKRAKSGLKSNGFFVLKENITKEGFVLDKDDQSITRSDAYFKELFKRCGLHIYKIKDQKGFPPELFAVKMYALVTEKVNSNSGKTRSQLRMPGIIKS